MEGGATVNYGYGRMVDETSRDFTDYYSQSQTLTTVIKSRAGGGRRMYHVRQPSLANVHMLETEHVAKRYA